MTTVRLGIIGFGAQGSSYARFLADGRVRDLVVTAVADVDPAREAAAAALAPGASFHADHRSLLASGEVDAVVVCTPHYLHPGIGIDALEHGLHVLVDKPAGVYAAQVAELNEAAAARPGQRFAIMFNQRANPLYRRLKEVVDEGGIGRILRSNWIITTWWRPQAYFDQSAWRATWGGEGGGVLDDRERPRRLAGRDPEGLVLAEAGVEVVHEQLVRGAPVRAPAGSALRVRDDLDGSVVAPHGEGTAQRDGGALGAQAELDRLVPRVRHGRVEDAARAGGVGEHQVGGVLDLDRQQARGGGAAHRGHLAEEPLQEVDGVDRLVHQHPAAALGPHPAPGAVEVVAGSAVPEHGRGRTCHGTQGAGRQQLAEALHGRVVAVLEADADARPAPLGRGDHLLALGDGGGERLLEEHRDAAVQGRDRQRGVRAVRSADVHDVGADGVEHPDRLGEARHRVPLGGRGEPARVGVADRHQLRAGCGADRREVDGGDVAAADHRRADGHRRSIPSEEASPRKARAATPNDSGPENPPRASVIARCGSSEATPVQPSSRRAVSVSRSWPSPSPAGTTVPVAATASFTCR
ncbi:hypothetical protein C5C82_11725 [Rathayibacter sp. AY1D5]|nr:hypothetical protein C5C82_11725 [Rathayibacter sp. AY1D5]